MLLLIARRLVKEHVRTNQIGNTAECRNERSGEDAVALRFHSDIAVSNVDMIDLPYGNDKQ